MRNNLNVYIIENEDPSRNSSGGVMSYIINLSKYLSLHNNKPVLIAAGPELTKSSEFLLPFRIIRNSYSQISNIKYLWLLFINMKKIPNETHIIIHCQRADYLLPFILFRRNAKLICTLHGMRDFGFALKKGKLLGKLYSVISGFCLKRAQRVIVVDKKSRDVFVKKYPWLINKISVIPIGIDLDIFKPMNKELLREKYGFSNSDKVVIFIGRLEMEKNVDFLIRVCTNLSNKINDLKLLIIGNGSKFNNLKKLVFDLNNDSVVFFGEIENTLISEIINIADVLALCSTYEGSPTVVKEALACNVRIVSNDVGDVKEVLKDFEGSFISKMELDEFEKALGSVLNSKTSHDYQDNIQKYSHINVSLETEAVYEKLY